MLPQRLKVDLLGLGVRAKLVEREAKWGHASGKQAAMRRSRVGAHAYEAVSTGLERRGTQASRRASCIRSMASPRRS
jgi:hypothetical protein